MVTTGHLTRLARAGGQSQEVARDQEPLLQQVRRECEEEGHQWTEAGLEAVTQLVGGLVTPDQRARTLVRAGLQLVTALHLAHSGHHQQSLGHVATAVDQLSQLGDQQLAGSCILQQLFPAGAAAPPEVGRAVLGRELDWQCGWAAVRSVRASLARAAITRWTQRPGEPVQEEDLEDVADGVMLEDVIRRQKLEAEIAEAEDAVSKFSAEEAASDEAVEAVPAPTASGDAAAGTAVDLTPSLTGLQTLSLSEDTGGWVSQGVSDSVPLPPSSQDKETSLPPPPPPCRSFHDRFLAGRSSAADAVKEIQKLRWTRDRTTAAVADSPFPDLSAACRDLVLVMVARGVGGAGGGAEDGEEELDIRRRVARWGYYHGRRDLQGFFIQHS